MSAQVKKLDTEALHLKRVAAPLMLNILPEPLLVEESHSTSC